MCSNYTPGLKDEIDELFRAIDHKRDNPGLLFDYPPQAFPGYFAPIIRLGRDVADDFELAPACFGMVPHWADLKLARQTYNARSETVATKPSFRNAWKKKQHCLIPARNFFEPCYATGKAVRWRIAHADDRPLGIAGIWEWKADGPNGLPMLSFSMLTINADQHPLMHNFHKPGEEKRMVAILEPEQYRPWLTGELPLEQALRHYPAEQLVAVADPLPPRTKSA